MCLGPVHIIIWLLLFYHYLLRNSTYAFVLAFSMSFRLYSTGHGQLLPFFMWSRVFSMEFGTVCCLEFGNQFYVVNFWNFLFFSPLMSVSWTVRLWEKQQLCQPVLLEQRESLRESNASHQWNRLAQAHQPISKPGNQLLLPTS